MNITERIIGFNSNVVFPELGRAQKPAIPEVAEMLRSKIGNGARVYGIIDIPIAKPWYQWMQDQLKKAGISPTGLYRTPIDDFIRQLGITDYYEGNEKTVSDLVKSFPKVSFYLIEHGWRTVHPGNQSLLTNVHIIPSGALADYPYNHF